MLTEGEFNVDNLMTYLFDGKTIEQASKGKKIISLEICFTKNKN